MARPAPAARRALDILNFLAAHPNESFTLSELSRRLEINGASAHAVLAVLVQDGYLVRHQVHKTYSLGPAVVALGHAALERHRVLALARDEMRELTRDLGVQVVATVATDEEILFVDRAGRYTGRDPSPRVGERVPLVPPLGTVFLAWSEPDTIDAWLGRLGPGTSADERDLYQASLEWVRQHGYAVGLEVEPREELGHALAELTDHPGSAPLRERLQHIVGRLSRTSYNVARPLPGTFGISYVAAPVFGPGGEVALALSAVGFEHAVDAAGLESVGIRLRRAAAAITAETNGRAPAA